MDLRGGPRAFCNNQLTILFLKQKKKNLSNTLVLKFGILIKNICFKNLNKITKNFNNKFKLMSIAFLGITLTYLVAHTN